MKTATLELVMSVDARPRGTQIPVEGATTPDEMFPIKGRGRRPWDRLPDEPGRIFKLFLDWLALPSRTPEKLREKCPMLTTKDIARLATTFQWSVRAEAYDRWGSSLVQHHLESAMGEKGIDIAKTIRALAVTAAIAAQRTLEDLQQQKKMRRKKDSHGGFLKVDGSFVMEPNPRFVPDKRVTIDLVKASTELVRLLAGQPGSVDEVERKKQANDLLKKLDEMAKSLAPQAPIPAPVIHDSEEQVQH